MTNNKKLAKNTLMLYIRMLFSMSVSLYTSRIVLNTLGVDDFGIYNIVGGVVLVFGFLNSAISASTQRFLSFEMGKGKGSKVSYVLNISIIIHIVISIVVIILSETIGVWFLNNQLNIPNERIIAANWVFQFSVFSFVISILYASFNALIISHERMNVFAIISITETALKLIITFFLSLFDIDKLILYGALVFLVSVIIGSVYVVYCKRAFNLKRMQLPKNKDLIFEMTRFAGWNLFGVFAGIAANQGVNILLNIFFNPAINAARGIAYQIQGAVTGFVTNFQTAVNPQIIKSYSSKDSSYMYSLVFKSSKYSYFLLFLLSVPIFIEAEYILNLWLKITPEHTIIFIRLVLIDVLVCSVSGPLQTLAQATGNIRIYQIVVSGILLLNLPISYFFLRIGLKPEITFIVSIICSLSAFIARLFVLTKMMFFPVKLFCQTVLWKILLVSLSVIFPLYISMIINGPFMEFVVVTFISLFISMAFILIIGLDGTERVFLKNLVIKRLFK
jgi:O-antigen/teichoic acid export membrane protein